MPTKITIKKSKSKRRKAPRRRKQFKKVKYTFTQALAPTYRAKLKYIDYKHQTLDNANPDAQFIFRLNDLFDPDFTATGHQAKYRDQYYTLYKHGRVMGFSIRIFFTHDNANPIRITAGPAGDNYTVSLNAFAEDRNVQKRLVIQDRPVTTYYRSYTDKHLAQRKGTWRTDNTFEQSSASPLTKESSCWYHVLISRFFNLQAVSTVCMQIEVIQYVEFSDHVPHGQS